ncbi:MAG: hypothetical protein QM722_14560 [Piscinibacter sp.]
MFPLAAITALAAALPPAFAEDSGRDGAPVARSTMSRAEVRALSAPEAAERDGAPIARSSLPRSEVLAELEIWRDSGLAALERGEASDTSGPSYRAALARYQALRDAPAFADQVARIARRLGETQLIAQQ